MPLALCALFFFRLADLTPALLVLVAATGLAHGVYGFWMTLAYARAELTRVYPIIRSTPALLPLIAIPLGESVTPLGALGIAVVVAGVWLVYGDALSLRRLFAPELVYAWLALGAGVAYSLADKFAMAELHAGAWRGPLPRPLAWYALLTLRPSPCACRSRSPGSVPPKSWRRRAATFVACSSPPSPVWSATG
ncbi:MAG: hypothetical protein ACHQ6V_11025 [Myxococcota bacterium]